jgi:nucleoid DNA-binding protein
VLKNNLNKIDLIIALSKKTGFSSNLSKQLVNNLIEIIIQNIREGNLNLKHLGTFKTIFKKERIGRNPKTKEEFVISSRKSISFTPSKKISEDLNQVI